MLRPFLNNRGVRCVTVNTGQKMWDETTKTFKPVQKTVPIEQLLARGVYSPVFNATSLRKEEWDRA
jgi:hypothetical protein